MSAEIMRKMLDQTSVVVTGICKGVNEFAGKTKTYWSVDLDVKGTKQCVNVRLPDNYDRTKLQDYEVVRIICKVMPSFDKKAIELHAIVS